MSRSDVPEAVVIEGASVKGLSWFLFLLGISMVANAISGKWAFERSKEGGGWVALDLGIAVGFFLGSFVLWKAAVRRDLAQPMGSERTVQTQISSQMRPEPRMTTTTTLSRLAQEAKLGLPPASRPPVRGTLADFARIQKAAALEPDVRMNLVDDYAAALLLKEPVMATLGEPVELVDDDRGLRIRLVGLHDPIEPTKDDFGADPGHRYVGIELEIENLSRDERSILSLTTALVDDRGKSYDSAPATRDPEFELFPDLEPNKRSRGFVLFELPSRAQPQRFVVGIDHTPAAAAWFLASNDAPEQLVASDVHDDAVRLIRRLAELRDEGILTDEEFQTKKAELLDRL